MAQDKKLGIKPGLIFTRTIDGAQMQFRVLEYLGHSTWMVENVNPLETGPFMFSSEEIRHRD